MARALDNNRDISKYDWILDSGTTSHICTARDAFTEFYPLTNTTIQGVGNDPISEQGRGTVILKFDFDGKSYRYQLRNTLYVPDAPNCLLSISRLDDMGGHVEFRNGECILKDKGNHIVGKGYKITDSTYSLRGLFYLARNGQIMPHHRNSRGISGTVIMAIFRQMLLNNLTRRSLSEAWRLINLRSHQTHVRPYIQYSEH